MALKRKAKDDIVQQYIGQYIDVDASPPWTESTVHENATILMATGCKRYALDPEDIAHLQYKEEKWIDPETGTPRSGHLYWERDFEEVARTKYSGPAELERARKDRLKPKRKRRRLNGAHPTSSSSTATQPIPILEDDEDLSGSDSDSDAMPLGTDALASMQVGLERDGKGWLWEILKSKVEEHILLGTIRSREEMRSAALLAARGPFVSRYPSRSPMDSATPSLSMRPSSKSFTKLHKLIAESDEPYEDAVQTTPRRRGPPRRFKWTADYDNKIYQALHNVTKEHGPKGWEEARWIVYDQYVKRQFGGMSVMRATGPDGEPQWQWGDTAAFWLHREEYKMGMFLKPMFSKLFDTQGGQG